LPRDGANMLELLAFISYLLTLYIYVLIAAAVMSWLIAFNVVNPRSPIVHAVGEFLYRITEPVLRPIRNMLPSMGGLDISPVILILIIIFIQSVIIPNIAKVLI
jgi:YggT family protein